MADASVRSVTALAPGSRTSPTLAEPTGAADGDKMVLIAAVDSPGGAPTFDVSLTSIATGVSSNTHFRVAIAYIERGSSALTAGQRTINYSGSAYSEGALLCVQDADDDFIDALAAAVLTNSTTVKPDPPSVDPDAADDLSIVVFAMWGGSPAAGGWVAPTGYTRQIGSVGGCALGVFTKQLTSDAVEDPDVPGGTPQAGDDGWAITSAVHSVVASGPEPDDPDCFLMTSGGLVATKGRVMTAGGLVPPIG